MNSTLVIRCVSVAALAASSVAQTLVSWVNGPAANAEYGKACIRVSDQNADGYADLLVGAPGFNQQRGAIYCLSGAWLYFGTGAQTLWSVAPSASPGDMFGYAVAEIGDVTNDGVSDFVVGRPGYDAFTTDGGAVQLVNGATHALGSAIYGDGSIQAVGRSIAACGDLAGSILPDVMSGAPGVNGSSYVFVIDGGSLSLSSPVNATVGWEYSSTQTGSELGASVAGGSDLDGDGTPDLAFGQPGYDNGPATDAGRVSVWLSSSHSLQLFHYASTLAGERMGQSLAMAHDYDGDGVVDIVAGAPNSLDALGGEVGRVVVLSGARLVAQTPPFEIRTLAFSVANGFDHHFGAAVCASDDLNGDGTGDILVGAPDYFTIGAGGSFQAKGHVSIFSGKTGERMGGISGGNTDVIGDAIAGAIDDLDGDGFREFVVAGSRSDAGGTDSGVVKCYRLFPVAPVTYCAGKVNSQGCTPSISSSGSPSAVTTAPFLVTATSLVNQKVGLLIYSHKPAAVIFQGGTLCVGSPTIRTPPQTSGGSASGNDCTGAFSFDFNDRIQNGPDPTLVAGAEVFAQYWARDPQSPSHSSLSNAIRFLISP